MFESYSKIWDIESVGVIKKELEVYQNFENELEIKEGRYGDVQKVRWLKIPSYDPPPPHPSPLFLLARLPIIKIVTICIEIFSKFSSISFFFFISYLGITELEGITFSYS